MTFPFINFDEGFLSSEDLLFLAGASGGTEQAQTTGNPAAFETDVAKPLVSLSVPFTPIQAGSGDPSPTNVRAISGFTGVNIVRCGVNLWDEEWETGDIDGNGQNTSGVDFRSKNYIPVIPGMKFYAYYELPGGKTPGSNLRLFYYDRNKTYISNTWAGLGVKTVPANAYYMRFYGDSQFGGVNDHVSFNYPSTYTEYHAYSGNSYAVTFPSGQTIYGGTLDAVTGVLTVNRAAYTEDGTTANDWGLTEQPNNINRFSITKQKLPGEPKNSSTGNLLCNWLKSESNQSTWKGFIGSTGNFLCYVPADVIADKAAWATYTSEHPLTFVYELDEPFTIQLDPVTIQTLIGNNTVWTDTNGENTVVYLKKK